MTALNIKALVSPLGLIVAMALMIFIAAGTMDFWQAWLFLIVYFAASLAITVYLIAKDPMLLQRRMRGGPSAERRPAQRIIQSFASFAFVALLVVPALDRRYGWSHVPTFLELTADAAVAAGFLVVLRVFKENTYTSATIELAPEQSVISTGPYALVRHPMYAAALGLLMAIPVALGSYVGLIVFVAIAAALIGRLLDEEKFLAANLAGYADYRHKVRYRLIPGVW